MDNILNIGTNFNFLHALCQALGSKLSKSVDKVEESMCIALNHVDWYQAACKKHATNNAHQSSSTTYIHTKYETKMIYQNLHYTIYTS